MAKFWRGITMSWGVPAVPFLSEAERIGSVGSVQGEDSVEMVDLVLEQLGPVTLEVGFEFVALHVLIPNSNPVRPLDPHDQAREGEAVVPDREVVGTDIDDFGIDERPGAIDLQSGSGP